jgi:hypothetical protein
MKKYSIVTILVLYWVTYGIVSQIIEPFSWFSSNNILNKLGYWGHLILLIVPSLPLIYLYFKKLKIEKYLGVTSFSSGSGRDDAFQNIRKKAKEKIFILGIAMSNISSYGKDSLAEQGKNVDIDLLMFDPDYLYAHADFTKSLETFLNMKDFRQTVRTSFEELKEFCSQWNSNNYNQHKFRLRTYNTIPTASMVLIDPDTKNGECVIEFFLYTSGEKRPRFNCVQIDDQNGLFTILTQKYTRLWNNSKIII